MGKQRKSWSVKEKLTTGTSGVERRPGCGGGCPPAGGERKPSLPLEKAVSGRESSAVE